MGNEKLLYPSVATTFYGNFSQIYKTQDDVIPYVLNGENVVLSAGTGSGKTEAVMAPLISRYLKKAIETDSLTILYIAPTKALVNDLERRLYPYLRKLDFRVGIRHGDQDDMKLRMIPHVLITTPESLDVMLFRGDKALDGIHAVVLDEIHLLYNTQRGLHLSILLNRLKQKLDHPLQWVAISATICNLQYVRDFLFGTNEEAVFLEDLTKREIDSQIRILKSMDQLKELFIKIFGSGCGRGKYLIFANSRRECEQIATFLSEVECLSDLVCTHYSSLSVEMREEVEYFFNNSVKAICISTSTLELGIDIGNIDAVFLYGPPPGVDSFLQRIGRSNRRSKKTNVICLVRIGCTNPYLEALNFHALIELAKEGNLPEKKPYSLFGSSVQQLLSYIGSVNGEYTRTSELAKLCSHLPHLERPTIELILGELEADGYLKAHGFKNRYGAGQKLYKLIDHRMIYGNFPLSTQEIRIIHGKKNLGYVSSINLLRLNRGSIIRFAGKKWKVKNIKKEEVEVTPINIGEPLTNLLYPGNSMGLDIFVISSILDLIQKSSLDTKIYSKDIQRDIQEFANLYRQIFQQNTIPFYRKSDGYVYFTLSGYIINKAIALITKQANFKATDITLTCSKKIEWDLLPTDPTEYKRVFQSLFEVNSNQTFYQTLLPKEIQELEFIQCWLCDSIITSQLLKLQKSSAVENSVEEMCVWELS